MLKSKQSLAYHTKSVHEKKKPYHCELWCNKYLKNKSTLKIQIQELHDLIAHKCKFWEKSIATKSGLNLHVKETHTDIEQHQCTFCNKTFIRNSDLNTHFKVVHEGKKTLNVQYVHLHLGEVEF